MRPQRKRKAQLAVAIVLAFVLALAWAGSAAAVEIRGGDNITIGKDEVIDDDLILGGNTVVIEGTVNGDLIVGGANIVLNGTVNGSLAFGGQSLTLNGKVAGSVYGGAASLTLGPNATVGRNVYFGGYSFETEPGSVVERDVLLGGYQGILGGEVGRDVKAGTGALELNGTVGGDVEADVGAPDTGGAPFGPAPFMPGMRAMVAPGLRVGPEADIGGKLTYTSEAEQASAIQATPEGGVVYQTPQPGERPTTGARPRVGVGFNILGWILARGRELITLLIFGALALWRLPEALNTVTDKVRTQTVLSVGWGVVVVIVGYIGAFVTGVLILGVGLLLGLVTLGGLSGTVFGIGFSGLGLAFTVFSLLVSYGSKLVVAYLVGKVLVQRLAPQSAANKALALGVGVVLYVIIRAIPILGWLVGVLATLIGLGAIWLAFSEWRLRAAPPAPTAAA